MIALDNKVHNPAPFVQCECSFCGPETHAGHEPDLRNKAPCGGRRRCTVYVHPIKAFIRCKRRVQETSIHLCGECEQHYLQLQGDLPAIKYKKPSGENENLKIPKATKPDDDGSVQKTA